MGHPEWNEPKKPAWSDNLPALSIRGLDFIKTNPAVFGRNAVNEIRKIVFLDHLPDRKGAFLPISRGKDKRVCACLTRDGEMLYIGAEGGINAADICEKLFSGLDRIEQIIFEGNSFHTETATDFSSMFEGCRSLKALSFAVFRTPKVTSFHRMFYGCENLTSLNLCHFDTSASYSFSYMFCGCRSLESLDVSTFQVHRAVKYAKLFDERCNAYWFHVPPSIEGMFCDCESLTRLDLRSFQTHDVRDFEDMFRNCRKLRKLLLSNGFVIRRDADTKNMFTGCESLDRTGLPVF